MIVPTSRGPDTRLVDTTIGILCAFDEYASRVSWFRVSMVYVLAMAPSFLVMILIELMPLATVEDGWAANWVFWIRCFITSIFLSFGVCMQFNTMVPLARFSKTSVGVISIGAACGYAIGLVLLAKYWAFPVPFTVVMGTPGWISVAASCAGLTIGWKRFRSSKILRKQLLVMILISNIQYSMLIVYPAYNAGFLALSGWNKVAFIVVLPAIKYLMKWLQKRAAGSNETGMILAKISADLFQALYSFKCMQSTESIESTLVLIGLDLVTNMHHLHGLHRKVHILQESLGHQFDSRNVVSSFIKLAQTSDPTANQRIQLHPINSNARSWQVFPSHSSGRENVGKKMDALLVKCQEILLVEFIESVVPIFYVLYLVILFHLPNAKYYPEMKHMTANRLEKLVGNIAIYAGLESLSLIYIHLMIKRQFNLSMLHLLAFTLENKQIILQGTFMAWVMINLQFTLVHYGECLCPCLDRANYS